MLAIFKILPDELLLVNYLRDVVYAKLTSENEYVTLEEMLLFRLTFDIAASTREDRLPQFTETL